MTPQLPCRARGYASPARTAPIVTRARLNRRPHGTRLRPMNASTTHKAPVRCRRCNEEFDITITAGPTGPLPIGTCEISCCRPHPAKASVNIKLATSSPGLIEGHTFRTS